jgi:hypothetical protein
VQSDKFFIKIIVDLNAEIDRKTEEFIRIIGGKIKDGSNLF